MPFLVVFVLDDPTRSTEILNQLYNTACFYLYLIVFLFLTFVFIDRREV